MHTIYRHITLTAIASVASVLTIIVLRDKWIRYFNNNDCVSDTDEGRAKKTLESWNDYVQEESVVLDLVVQTRSHKLLGRVRNRYASLLATRCKLAIPGVAKHTAANRLVAHHFMVKTMEKDGVRPSHQASILAVALEFVITPTNDEIDARRMAQTTSFLDAYEDGTRLYHTRTASSWWGGLGSKRSRAQPPGC